MFSILREYLNVNYDYNPVRYILLEFFIVLSSELWKESHGVFQKGISVERELSIHDKEHFEIEE